MKKRLFAVLICVCMILSSLPVVSANAFGDLHEAQVFYNEDVGSVFMAAGYEKPTADAEFYCRNGDELDYTDNSGFVSILADPDICLDWGVYFDTGDVTFVASDNDFKATVNLLARYEKKEGGWYSEPIVRAGVPCSGMVTVDENGVYSVDVSDIVELDIELYWTESEFDYALFEGTDEKEIIIEIEWGGRGEIEFDPNEDSVRLDDRFKFRVSSGQKSVMFTWKEGFKLRSVLEDTLWGGEWNDLPVPEDNCYLLQLDGKYAGDGIQYYYHLRFEFEGENGRNWTYRVEYDENNGSVFSALGEEIPDDTSEFYTFRGEDRSFKSNYATTADKPQTINLLLDTGKYINWDVWYDEERIEFRDNDDWTERTINVVIEYETSEGYLYKGVYVIDGELVRSDPETKRLVQYRDGVLSFTPENKGDVTFYVYWTINDLNFSLFEPTQDKPILVEYRWWGRGEVTLSEEVDPYDMITSDGRVKIRVPESTGSLTFNWKPGYELREIWINGAGEYGGWLEIEHPEGTSYTLALDLTWDNGDPRDYYEIQFDFEGSDLGYDQCVCANYDRGRGSLFFALGDEIPAEDAEHYFDSYWDGMRYYVTDKGIERVNILIDPYLAIDWDAYEYGELAFQEIFGREEPHVCIVARYEDKDGYYIEEAVVRNGVSQSEAFKYEDNVLSFTPAAESGVELDIYWSEDDLTFYEFGGTEEKPVVIEVQWWNRGEIKVADEIPAEDMLVLDGRIKMRVPLDKETVTLTWKPGYELIRISGDYFSENNDWGEIFNYEGTSFVIVLDEIWGDGSPRDYYTVNFEFEGGMSYGGLLEVNYPEWDGSVFAAVGDGNFAADGSDYVFRGWEGEISFERNGEPAEVRLLLDPTKRLDFDHYYETGEIRFKNVGERDDLSINVAAYFEDAEGYLFYGLIVEKGASVYEGVTFENNILTFTPASAGDVSINVFWSDEDCEFGMFGPTDERPIKVDINWWGHGDVSLPEDFPEEDYLKRDGNIVARVSPDTGLLELSWPENDVARSLTVRYDGEGENYFVLEPVAGNSYTLELNKPGWGDENFAYYYHVEIEFEERETEDYTVYLDFPAAEGSVFFNVGEPAPALDENYYIRVDK